MSDRIALLRAILASPDDDLPRLVYADWLDDNGTTDADKARSEFIRLGCKMKAKKAMTPTEGKWLDENWERLLANFVSIGSKKQPTDAYREGRFLLTYPSLNDHSRKQLTGCIILEYSRGFATCVTFITPADYLYGWEMISKDEPIATHLVRRPELDINWSTYGEGVFQSVLSWSEGTTEIIPRKCFRIHANYSDQLNQAMTSIAREYNGLTPATDA